MIMLDLSDDYDDDEKRMYSRRRIILSIKFKEDLSNLDREVRLFELCRRLQNTTKLRTTLEAIKKTNRSIIKNNRSLCSALSVRKEKVYVNDDAMMMGEKGEESRH